MILALRVGMAPALVLTMSESSSPHEIRASLEEKGYHVWERLEATLGHHA